MTPTTTAAAIWTALWVAVLLRAEATGSARGAWIAKPLASLGFLAAAYGAGALESRYGELVMAGLAACALGDILLLPRGAGAAFLAGMGAFALGHAAYALAFAGAGVHRSAGLIALAAMIAVTIATLRWLGPRLPAAMQWPVRGYIAVISMMVVLAVSASASTSEPLPALGAILFAASDLSVARERFVRPAFANLIWGLPMYYGAQLVLAFSARAA